MTDIDEIRARWPDTRGAVYSEHAMDAVAGAEIHALCDEVKRLREAMQLAYGFLWHMDVDKKTLDGQQKSRARAVLYPLLSFDARSNGIYAANKALGDYYRADILATDPEGGQP